MDNKLSLGILTDDPPVGDNIIASGMSRVNTRLFRAISEKVSLISTSNLENFYSFADISEDLESKCDFVEHHTYALKIIRRLNRYFPSLGFEEILFQYGLNRLVKKFHKSDVNWIFCPCGVNPFALGRAIRLAEASQIPLAAYLVDDFLSGAVLSGNKRHLIAAQNSVPKWLSKVDRLFVISEGLRRRVKELYNLNSEVLPLPYDPPEKLYSCSDKNKQEIIFVGNLSHFYLDGLKKIAAILDDLNRDKGTSLTLRFTLPTLERTKQLIGDFNCIRCIPCLDTESLQREIASSLFCFAPYSFDPKYKEMVLSSFPSKMLDYLAFGKFIVTYAPEYASSTLYFKEHHLPEVVSVENSFLLGETILKQLDEQKDCSQQYREVIERYHSPKYIANRLLTTLESI